jgi:hypothetical protein
LSQVFDNCGFKGGKYENPASESKRVAPISKRRHWASHRKAFFHHPTSQVTPATFSGGNFPMQ